MYCWTMRGGAHAYGQAHVVLAGARAAAAHMMHRAQRRHLECSSTQPLQAILETCVIVADGMIQ